MAIHPPSAYPSTVIRSRSTSSRSSRYRTILRRIVGVDLDVGRLASAAGLPHATHVVSDDEETGISERACDLSEHRCIGHGAVTVAGSGARYQQYGRPAGRRTRVVCRGRDRGGQRETLGPDAGALIARVRDPPQPGAGRHDVLACHVKGRVRNRYAQKSLVGVRPDFYC